MDEDKLVIERVFDAPREKVWKAWTEPEQIKKWLGPEGFSAPSIEIDLREGGKYIYAMQGPKGSKWDKVMHSAGVFKEVVPMEKIVSSDYFSDEHGNKKEPMKFGQKGDFPDEMEVTVTFEDAPEGKTKLTITIPLPDDEGVRKAIEDSRMDEGWNSSLNKLSKLVGQGDTT